MRSTVVEEVEDRGRDFSMIFTLVVIKIPFFINFTLIL
jgi:hypothetical protein